MLGDMVERSDPAPSGKSQSVDAVCQQVATQTLRSNAPGPTLSRFERMAACKKQDEGGPLASKLGLRDQHRSYAVKGAATTTTKTKARALGA